MVTINKDYTLQATDITQPSLWTVTINKYNQIWSYIFEKVLASLRWNSISHSMK